MVYEASLLVSPTKSDIPSILNPKVLEIANAAIQRRGAFTIALSGGSLPGFLSPGSSEYDKWHVILADERCVVSTDPDSNLGALQQKFLSKVGIPPSQIHGINESKLQESAKAVASAYEATVKSVLDKTGGRLDLSLLGFGPDGHTCSLFPDHALLQETTLYVASITDSPKPPPQRITLTFKVLNQLTRNVIFCGAGSSKAPILQKIFESVTSDGTNYKAVMKEPYPFPCAGVLPNTGEEANSLVYVVDEDAMEGVATTSASSCAAL